MSRSGMLKDVKLRRYIKKRTVLNTEVGFGRGGFDFATTSHDWTGDFGGCFLWT